MATRPGATPDLPPREHYRLLSAAREREREAIARELHDELGQLLIGLKMEMASLAGALRASPRLAARCRGMLRSIDAAVEEVRSVAERLHPLILRDLGFVPAVEWLVRDFERRTGIRCRLTRSGKIALDLDRAAAAFRVLQEALTNAARHSGASRVAISLKAGGGGLRLAVSDNGGGLPPGGPQTGGRGLEGMKTRAAAFGGDVTATGAAGKGTTIALKLPPN